MPTKLPVESSKKDVFMIDTDDIVVDHELNSRHFPVSDKDVESLAHSIFKQGQLQACQIRRDGDEKVTLVFGFTRYRAVCWINEHLNPPNRVRLMCSLFSGNEEEAFVRNVTENRERNNASAVDDAHAHRKLRDVFGWDNQRIAEQYRMTTNWVAGLANLLVLDDATQRLVASKQMTVTNAISLAKLEPAKRSKVLAESVDEDGLSSGKFSKAMREVRGKGGRSMKEVRDLFESLTCDDEADPVGYLAETFLEFCKGTVEESEMAETFKKLTVERLPREIVKKRADENK